MDTWADVDAAFEAVMNQRKKRQDNLDNNFNDSNLFLDYLVNRT